MCCADEPVCVIVIRMWREGDAVRARITHTRDVVNADPTSEAIGSVEEIIQIVRDRIESFQARQP